MSDLEAPKAFCRVAATVLGFALAAVTSGCGPSLRDMPAVVTLQDSDAVSVLFPVCASDSVRLVRVYGDEEFARWDLYPGPSNLPEVATVEELVFSSEGIDAASQIPGLELSSEPEQGPVNSSFYSLDAIDIQTTIGQAYLEVELLEKRPEPQWFLATFPYRNGEAEIETVTEEEGRGRLLEWCDS